MTHAFRQPPALFAACLLASPVSAQVFGTKQQVADIPNSVPVMRPADLDGDGDLDVLWSGVNFQARIGWSENLGGGTFGAPVTITLAEPRPSSLHVTDVDGDGDADILVSEYLGGQVSWYENLASGVFGQERVISSLASGATDLDGDGDIDVLSASVLNDTIAWYENQGGGTFGPQQVLSTSADAARSVAAVDLDGDGDSDVLSASADDDTLAWYENQGAASFGSQQVIATNVNRAWDIAAADLDGDGDPDVVAAAFGGREVVWFEHQGLGGAFCRPAAINGAGLTGKIAARGSTRVADNALVLEARDLTPSNFAIFLASPNEAVPVRPPNSIGNLCLGAPIGRYVGPGQIRPTGPQGITELPIDLGRTPSPTGFVQIQPGETWRFQCWHRDSVLGMATSNFTDAVGVMFR